MDILLDTRGRQRIVLLLYLYVVGTIGYCSVPVLVENIVLSDAALLLNKFPNNTVIPLECANGYVKDKGPGTMKCMDETWSEPALTCKKKDCGPPKLKAHMLFNTSQSTLFGAVVTVNCDKGYRIKGSRFKQCYNAGWTGKASCESVKCDKPVKITNGKSSWDSADYPSYGEYVQYFCDEGYTLVGNSLLRCTEHGVFDSKLPQCQAVIKEDVFITTPEPPTSTPPAQGGGDILSTEAHTTSTITSTMTSLLQGYMPVIISVVCVLLVVCIAVLFIHKLLLKRKGSYDTREDLKPELLQFQNL